MPYASNAELPASVKDLPNEAKTVFRRVFNDTSKSGKSEEQSFAYAWTAVKNGWKKNSENKWEKINKSLDNSDKVDYNSGEFEINASVAKVDDSLGLVFGYAMVCKIEGQDHFDLQGDHIPEDTMIRVLADFVKNGAVAKAMHRGEQIGTFPFVFPLTTDIAKSLGIQAKQTGALVAMKPDGAQHLNKFASGEWTGFSIGGFASKVEYVE